MNLLQSNLQRQIGTSFACAAAIAASLVWFAWFLRLFPLSEFRDWLAFFEEPSVVRQTIDNLLFRTTRYSRDFSLLYVGLMSNACVDSLVCVNLLAALPLLLATLLFFLLVRQFTGSTVLAALAVVLWSLSTPYLDTMAWQATILDRVGICFAMFALLLVWRVPIARSVTSSLLQALVFCALTFASLNSKEAYWFVPIMVALAYAGRVLVDAKSDPNATKISWSTIVLIPMLVYSTWFAYRYSVATPFATNWTEHVSSGGVLSNLHAQSKNVFRGALVGYVAILSLLLACVVTLWSRGAAPIERVRALWLATLLILTYLPAAQARNAATYYMLPVLASALLAMAWWASLVLHGANRRVGARVHFAIVAIATISGLFAAHLRSSAFQMRDRAEQSRAFITTHVTPDVVRDVLQSGKLCFEVDPRDPMPVLFVDSPRAYALLRWVAQPQDYAQLREIPVLVNYPGRGTQFSAADCTARFVKYR